MPWRVKDVMEQRIELVFGQYRGKSRSAGCAGSTGQSADGIPLGAAVWEAGSVQGLAERSRRPQHSPGRTPIEQKSGCGVAAALWWGAKKLVVLLAREGIALRVVTVNRILKRRACW